MDEIRVFITDDDPLVRVALSHLVSRDPRITVVGEAENGEEALEAIEQLGADGRPDVVMMDVRMPVMDGVEASAQIRSRWPEIRILAVTTLDTREAVIPMLSVGAGGYILKEAKAEEISTAVKQTFEGASPLSPRIAALLVQHVRSGGRVEKRGSLPALTSREEEVLNALALGMSNAEMAQSLGVSEGTIKAHLGSIMSKWDARDRVQVLVAAAKAGLVSFN